MGLSAWTYAPSKQPDELGDYEYTEMRDSYSMSFTPGGGVTRIYLVAYEFVDFFMDDLLGYSTVDNNGTSINWNKLPDQDKYYTNCYALEATMDPMGIRGKIDETSIPDYALAKVTVQYKQVDFAVKANGEINNEFDRFVTRVGGYDGEYFTVSNSPMRLVSNIGGDGTHLALSQPPSRITGVQQWTYIWRYVPAITATPFKVPNHTALQNCLGKVHAPSGNYDPSVGQSFDRYNNAFLPGTVLFVGAEPRMHTSRPVTGTRNGNFQWEIAMKFLYRDNGLINRTTAGGTINERAGHQFIWDQNLSRWDLITSTGLTTGNRLYEAADLNTLFTIG